MVYVGGGHLTVGNIIKNGTWQPSVLQQQEAPVMILIKSEYTIIIMKITSTATLIVMANLFLKKCEKPLEYMLTKLNDIILFGIAKLI